MRDQDSDSWMMSFQFMIASRSFADCPGNDPRGRFGVRVRRPVLVQCSRSRAAGCAVWRGIARNRSCGRAGSYHSPVPLRDLVRPGVQVLLVGINPGIRSEAIGHHFAGYSNRFWKLLYDAGLVAEAIGPEDDGRLPEWALGLTNLIPRATPGIDSLRPDEYAAGIIGLRRKVRRWRPAIVAFVGVSLYRAVFAKQGPIALGPQLDTFAGARVFVLPNPSGRNANFSYDQMLQAFKGLAALRRVQGS